MPEVVSVVATGPSALETGAARAPGFVIAVNDAFRHVRHDAVLSMDGRWCSHRFLEAVNGKRQVWLRNKAFGHVDFTDARGEQSYPNLFLFECEQEAPMTGDMSRLNGRNSAHCALSLAYAMRPKVVYLFGFDHKGYNHFFNPYEWFGQGCHNTPNKFRQWNEAYGAVRRQFDAIGCAVFNTNKQSAVKAFRFKDCP